MWEKVASRKHQPLKIFPFGSSSDEVMLYGNVDYVLKDGKQASVPWAARAHLVKEGGAVKMDFYQVYLVSHISSIIITISPGRHRFFQLESKEKSIPAFAGVDVGVR